MTDYEVATRYIKKMDLVNKSGGVFELTFNQFKRLITAKNCRYTGLKLKHYRNNTVKLDPLHVTLDRIDNSLGYVHGNVVPCAHFYNEFKSILENPNNVMTVDILKKAIKVQDKLEGKK